MLNNSNKYEAVKPYADHHDDGIMQLSFTLPIPYTLSAKRAALSLASKMGLLCPEVIHYQEITKNHTYFIVYGQCLHTINYAEIQLEGLEIEYWSKEEVEEYIQLWIGKKIIVVGASTGTDTHSVGIDAMLNLKGFDGQSGLEAYCGFETHNLGSQVSNDRLVAKAIEVNADVILVSQTVTQQQLHIHNLTNLVDIIEAEGLRKKVILICGGARISNELAKELGYDAGFSKGSYPNHLASFIVRELGARIVENNNMSNMIRPATEITVAV